MRRDSGKEVSSRFSASQARRATSFGERALGAQWQSPKEFSLNGGAALQYRTLYLPFKDIVWHASQLWFTNDYGLWNLDGERLVPAVLPSSEIAVCAGNLSVGDGVLLMAGTHGAAIHDGTSWKLIFNTLQFT